MKNLTLITIGLSLLLIFAACSDSNNILSPAEDLTVEPVGEETVLAKAMADPVGTLTLISAGVPYTLTLSVTDGANPGDWGGLFKISAETTDIEIPVRGRVRIRKQNSGEFRVRIRARGREKGVGVIRLEFRGTGTRDPETGAFTGTGTVKGIFGFGPEGVPSIRLNGPAFFSTLAQAFPA